MQVKTLVILFSNRIKHNEIPLLRGAVLNTVRDNGDVLFHNHVDGGFRFDYPLIQYKRLDGKAAIVCVNNGIDSIQVFLAQNKHCFMLGRREVDLQIEHTATFDTDVDITATPFSYCITDWLPLNEENYGRYIRLGSDGERKNLLEHILVGNVLSMLKSLDIHADKQVVCTIEQLTAPKAISYKTNKLLSFSLSFCCNVCLPLYTGIGKGVSKGYGVILAKRNK